MTVVLSLNMLGIRRNFSVYFITLFDLKQTEDQIVLMTSDMSLLMRRNYLTTTLKKVQFQSKR